jgi:hypothetical protein
MVNRQSPCGYPWTPSVKDRTVYALSKARISEYIKEEEGGGRRKEEGGRRKKEGGRRKEEGREGRMEEGEGRGKDRTVYDL